ALAFGSLIHDILDQIYTNHTKNFSVSVKDLLQKQESKDRQKIIDRGTSNTEAVQTLEENYAAAEPVLTGYLDRWREDFLEVEWVALE
ncbi:hypothetical protein, partial [Streptococcus pneumoniae]|uniref:hypothetical protein n=1 Tax=Streptococcus pneumoniae TaxID=1313 RepID=UPI0018B02241